MLCCIIWHICIAFVQLFFLGYVVLYLFDDKHWQEWPLQEWSLRLLQCVIKSNLHYTVTYSSLGRLLSFEELLTISTGFPTSLNPGAIIMRDACIIEGWIMHCHGLISVALGYTNRQENLQLVPLLHLLWTKHPWSKWLCYVNMAAMTVVSYFTGIGNCSQIVFEK